MNFKRFEDIEVYQSSIDFGVKVFKLTENSNINRNIVSQLERAALSISNNIAEGFELQSNKQFVKFLYIAKGSAGECRSIISFANKLGQIEEKNVEELRLLLESISKQLSRFISYLIKSEID